MTRQLVSVVSSAFHNITFNFHLKHRISSNILHFRDATYHPKWNSSSHQIWKTTITYNRQNQYSQYLTFTGLAINFLNKFALYSNALICSFSWFRLNRKIAQKRLENAFDNFNLQYYQSIIFLNAHDCIIKHAHVII